MYSLFLFLLQQVAVPPQCKVIYVTCGADFTFLLTCTGRLMACGNNEENQMGLNTPRGLQKRQAVVSAFCLSEVRETVEQNRRKEMLEKQQV